jgi:membrane dipeptidase
MALELWQSKPFMRRSTLLLATVLLMTACAPDPPPPLEAEDLEAKAERLAQDLLIVDTHVDFPYRQRDDPADVSQRTEDRNFDYAKARAGGLNAPFMSIYIPSSYQEKGGAKELAEELIEMIEGLERDHPDKFAIARSPADVETQFADGVISLPMGMENGEAIEGDLANVAYFHERGIRYIGLTHGENNHISDSSYADEKEWNGLSPFGHEVVAEMNRVGIMVDTSHLSDDAFWQILEISKAPVIASHSSCRKFTPDWERNIGDEMIQALAAAGGVVQINYGNAFLTQAANHQSSEFWKAAEEAGLEPGSNEAEAWREAYWQEHKRVWPSVSNVVDHIDHVVELVGVDHVGLGSDFDGVGDSLPKGLKDASQLPNLILELLERGYSDDDIAKIAGGNLMRVWRSVEQVAAEMQAAS